MINFRMNHGVKSGVQKRNPAGEKRSLSTACHRRHRLCSIYMVDHPPKQKSFKGTVAAFSSPPEAGKKVSVLQAMLLCLKNKNPVPAYNMLGQDQKHPAVPPGLTQTRPTHPYHHTVALFTECRSVAHRAGPPAFRLPSEVHSHGPVRTALSALRSSL